MFLLIILLNTRLIGGSMKLHWFIWFPRVLLILLCLFFFYISTHVFGWYGSSLHLVKEFLIHSIPTILLLFSFWVSRKNPFWCGIILIILGYTFTLQFHTYRHHLSFETSKEALNFLIRSLLPILTGILFIITHYLKPKEIETK
jgi:hypothetical protein